MLPRVPGLRNLCNGREFADLHPHLLRSHELWMSLAVPVGDRLTAHIMTKASESRSKRRLLFSETFADRGRAIEAALTQRGSIADDPPAAQSWSILNDETHQTARRT